ncbi:DUF1345 domain-containing protein [Mesorhizobium sp. M0152]|uniref:DUF1345 domain-containing protein n=1 Tax=Mesorhizobium sp. M0152 TaxID=2956898 RepID=UPI00333B6F51
MATDTSMKPPMHRHMQFMAALCVGAATLAIALFSGVPAPHSTSIGANAFFVAYLALVLAQMPRLKAGYLSHNARDADLPLLGIFAITVAIVATAIFLLFNAKGTSLLWLLVTLVSVPLGWFTIHAMAAMHYAHVYWMDGDVFDDKTKKKIPVGGLDFPGGKRPEGWDFLYFATVIGMTAQTADTSITTSHMRQVVMVHSILSFFFNTVIVAAAVNLAINLR